MAPVIGEAREHRLRQTGRNLAPNVCMENSARDGFKIRHGARDEELFSSTERGPWMVK